VNFWMDNFNALVGIPSGSPRIKTTGILSSKPPQPPESPARNADELLEQENMYETHDANIGTVNDWGAEVCSILIFR